MRFDLEAAKQDCEGMLRVLNAMDRQLNQYCSREDAVAEVISAWIYLMYLLMIFRSSRPNAKREYQRLCSKEKKSQV